MLGIGALSRALSSQQPDIHPSDMVSYESA
ncbi:hypothetical protein EMIT0P12_80240 [Pseudomonas sp. IT-P12]